ncbi:branched-chain amino acid ABC transporter permease [Nocardioides sp. MAH-18]|uniref:Branched-chain amino acid ABC transporter permease n=1 Tax=Nocardioides agri TaxID=2682843 RepID=A0A6L6XR53_9ACTN|nr:MULTISPECIES: branched-chain amino acid ABC transporter permease [unclassified Nocardioides]MBA2953206.1 branched-chain amino acid ABC transporter permease [Nocardioides sp. CGMCC 1.13656]MVQ48075.1 branched-chain amino acid ABC transporter permease [Nocardioides sp. MAH-18]
MNLLQTLPWAVPGVNDAFFDLSYVLQLVTTGLANGAVYALMALSVVIVYRTTGHMNFAQGEMGTIGCLLVFSISVERGVPYWISIPAAIALSMVVGAVLQRTLVQPVERRGGMGVVLVTLGLFLIINAVDAVIWGADPVTPVTPFPSEAGDRFIILDGPPQFAIRYSTIGIWITLAVVVGLLWLLLQRTRLGLGYRAVAANPESALLVGIPKDRMLMLGWALAAGIGTLAAVLFSQKTGSLDFNLMAAVILYGLAAAALGGFDSIPGAVVGGAVVGLVESLVPAFFSFIGSELSLVMALVVIVAVLLVRPQGIFGKAKVVRV